MYEARYLSKARTFSLSLFSLVEKSNQKRQVNHALAWYAILLTGFYDFYAPLKSRILVSQQLCSHFWQANTLYKWAISYGFSSPWTWFRVLWDAESSSAWRYFGLRRVHSLKKILMNKWIQVLFLKINTKTILIVN